MDKFTEYLTFSFLELVASVEFSWIWFGDFVQLKKRSEKFFFVLSMLFFPFFPSIFSKGESLFENSISAFIFSIFANWNRLRGQQLTSWLILWTFDFGLFHKILVSESSFLELLFDFFCSKIDSLFVSCKAFFYLQKLMAPKHARHLSSVKSEWRY